MLNVLIIEETQTLIISCDCEDEGKVPTDAPKLSFSLNSKSVPITKPSPSSPACETDSADNIPKMTANFTWWKVDDYLIIQIGSDSFLIFAPLGQFVGRVRRNEIDGLIESHRAENRTSPSPKP